MILQLRALVLLEHDGRQVAAGETFAAAPLEAAALVYQHRAECLPPEAPRAPRRRRTYRRRDLRAEA